MASIWYLLGVSIFQTSCSVSAIILAYSGGVGSHIAGSQSLVPSPSSPASQPELDDCGGGDDDDDDDETTLSSKSASGTRSVLPPFLVSRTFSVTLGGLRG